MASRRREAHWEPTPEFAAASRMGRFLDQVRKTHGIPLADSDYAGLHQWSVRHLDEFWREIVRFFDVDLGGDHGGALETMTMPGTRWFDGASVSYVEQVFRDRDPDAVAVIAVGEPGERRELNWAELRLSVARIAGFLRHSGVVAGDTVAAYLPNGWHTVVAFLATASIGAIWSSCSPDFGPQAVTDRLAQIEPKVLFATDGYVYKGTVFDRSAALAEIGANLPTLRQTVLVPADGVAHRTSGVTPWSEAFSQYSGDSELDITRVPFGHPLWVLYSSGTTGLPKAIVHSHGGILLEHLKWLGLQTDLGTRDRVLWLTTTGWVMWNFLVGTLLVGAVPVLYDGSAGHPTISSPWDIAAENGVTCFGAGASYHTACMKAEARLPVAKLGSLRMIGSTGSPLPPEAYDYLYEQFGSKIWLFSTSGGTDVATAFVGGSPLVPARRGELQGPALGVDVQAWDEQGNRLVRGVGELVVTKPMPSMPVRLWNDPGDHRLRETYFSTYPGAWRHGDWIEFLENGGALVHGRSDSTINRGGVRIGTAEVYRAVARVPEVVDATIVDVPRKGQENWMVLFVSLPEGVTLGSHLRARIVREIRAACSPRHVPDDVLGVPGVPRTLSGKVLEVPIKRLLMGEAPDRVVSRDSLANPESLDWFVAFAGSLSNTRENTSTEGSNAHVSR